MPKPACFLLNVNDWLSSDSVEMMSGDQVKAYVYLLCRAWHNDEQMGTLPDDDVILARYARLSLDNWNRIKKPILAKFPINGDGRRSNPRQMKEVQYWLQHSHAGSSGWDSLRRKMLAKRNIERSSKRKAKR